MRRACRTARCWWWVRPVRCADCGRPASRRPCCASGGGRCAPLRPLLSREGCRHLARGNGLLRHAGGAPSAREGVRDNTNHYVTGRDGGRDIDLRKFATEGMRLYGLLDGLDGTTLTFAPTLKSALSEADRVYNGINAAIDKHIAEQGIAAPPPSVYEPVWEPETDPVTLDLAAEGITSIIWCIGFQPDFRWLDAPVFNGSGTRSIIAGSRRCRASISSACPGCTPGARGASPASTGTPAMWRTGSRKWRRAKRYPSRPPAEPCRSSPSPPQRRSGCPLRSCPWP